MDDHISNATLERHAAGQKLQEAEPAAIEEHLLVCQACRERLRGWDEYIAAMRQGLKKLTDEG